jgi:glutamyl/glutaminyl-tRNA synthetase
MSVAPVTRFAPSPTGELHPPAPQCGHLALITGDDGAPLSKRNGAVGLGALREQGILPEAIANHLQRSPAHFQMSQLLDWQCEAVHRFDPARAAVAAADKSLFIAAATGLRGPALFKPLRAALTGKLSGPEPGPLLRAMPDGMARQRLTRFA